MREANERWARFVLRIVETRYGGNQSSLASAIGVSPSTVTRWIDGATPTITALHTMRNTLDISMVDLLVAAGALDPDDNIETSGSTESATVTVADAILQDAGLLDEAREHLLAQYELLLRVGPKESATRGKQTPRRAQSPSGTDRRLRAVAHKGDPEDRAEMERRAREVRKQQKDNKK